MFARERKKIIRARVPNICYCCCCCCRCFSGFHVRCCHCVLHFNAAAVTAAARHRLLHLTACLLFLSSPPPSQTPQCCHLFRQSHSRPARRRFLRVPARPARPKDASGQVRPQYTEERRMPGQVCGRRLLLCCFLDPVFWFS